MKRKTHAKIVAALEPETERLAVVRTASGFYLAWKNTLMPDYTYLQAAQPTTAGHWALSFAYPALRDIERSLRKRLRRPLVPGTNAHVEEAKRQLVEYFAGSRKSFDLPLAMAKWDGLLAGAQHVHRRRRRVGVSAIQADWRSADPGAHALHLP